MSACVFVSVWQPRGLLAAHMQQRLFLTGGSTNGQGRVFTGTSFTSSNGTLFQAAAPFPASLGFFNAVGVGGSVFTSAY